MAIARADRLAPVPRPIEQLPQIRSAVGFYRVMSWVTGVFLLLLVAEMVLKYSPTHVEVFAGGSRGPLALAPVVPAEGCQWYSLFVPGGMGCEIASLGDGFNVSLAILIVHGWIYVVYLLACFRLWSKLRWPFGRLLAMALGGVVPFLSFIVEHRMHRVALDDLARLEAERARRDDASATAAASTPQEA
ncbi:integral membrane protein [Agrococcus carbonis]|uniref:Integral membrane protein n=1 Tax=Agrococcus carbonis TaxID=684552 RepID=A0A1H1QWW0_9MICO|nr:integral membrane protein [Agrococcus carbonis]